ncbi:MAG: hypothetical protein BWK73_32450 [Thiothrix lacustris]|uniref:Secreted protein n=1 Tax=Thiothrix lacustris TaxID=525917 RepID=A0A1Y1QHM9_9GAMM|nr:MAG: hypothetical protein BWK73_32450 [Thiothrix lacustris]
MKTLFATMMLVSAVIATPAFAEEADVKDVLATGNAAELSSTEMQATTGASWQRTVRPTTPSRQNNSQNNNNTTTISGESLAVAVSLGGAGYCCTPASGASATAGHWITNTTTQTNNR